ncbi:MAG: hypothetical protein Q9191_007690, partial [Dirinaria sp. TL-2023a]
MVLRQPNNETPACIDRKANKHWMVPRAASAQYTGRRELGDRLTHAFSHNSPIPLTGQRRFVIVGMGGAGKSEVCLKFAETHQD